MLINMLANAVIHEYEPLIQAQARLILSRQDYLFHLLDSKLHTSSKYSLLLNNIFLLQHKYTHSHCVMILM